MSDEIQTECGSEVLVSHDVRDHGGSDYSVLASTLNATRAKNANIERSQRLPTCRWIGGFKSAVSAQ